MSHDDGEKKGLQYGTPDAEADTTPRALLEHSVEIQARAAAEAGTLRDRFAMCALSTLAVYRPDGTALSPDEIAWAAWRIADEMVATRDE